MPCIPSPEDGEPRRRRIAPPVMPFIVCVARPVGKAELEREEKARAARGQERDRLRVKRAR
eukprot:7229597-Lingulodinium_polyedra.AAC.1